ncbi:hypothetical protein [Halarcobacter anaerophilus]|uniref:hypothetical protein n=1 Tax=Halarcobacter anaerophilus TaxID=877500 RepID=UPI000AF2FD6F|nr:hypothetical protein [Halarcobacter anaerophilus]
MKLPKIDEVIIKTLKIKDLKILHLSDLHINKKPHLLLLKNLYLNATVPNVIL